MPEARGMISGSELRTYGGSDIMLLDGINDQITSGQQSASGSGTFSWEITWSENGFTGQGWGIGEWSSMGSQFQEMYENDHLVSYFENPTDEEYDMSRAFLQFASGSFTLNYNGCVDFERLD